MAKKRRGDKIVLQKITPCLWFDRQAEEAVQFYLKLFKNSRITAISRYDEASAKVSGRPKGSVLTISFTLDGQEFIALNGGPNFKFTEAISFVINCDTQKEIDMYWTELTKGGQEVQCGWLKDKYGLSWQVSPRILDTMIASKDKAGSERAMKAMLKMKKLDIKKLEQAFNIG